MSLIKFEKEVRITRRLKSSRTSGAYWDMYDPLHDRLGTKLWGCNSSPYNPLFDIYTPLAYELKIEPLLVDQLESDPMNNLIYPRGHRREVEEFVREMVEPLYVYIGFCYFKDISPKNLHRLSEFFVIERGGNACDLHEDRGDVVNAVREMIPADAHEISQGHLKGRVLPLPFAGVNAEKMRKIIAEARNINGEGLSILLRGQQEKLFNHVIKVDHIVYLMRYDNSLLILPKDKDTFKVKLISYDHEEVVYVAQEEGILFTHPFPQNNRTD